MMPVITEQKRQELIEYCNDVIAAHVQYGGNSDEEEVYRIALASLEAKPFDHFGDATYKIALYAAPPVPVMKPVVLPDMEEDELAFNAGVNALIDCLEDCGDAEQGLRLALRAIRAAGYPVEGEE